MSNKLFLRHREHGEIYDYDERLAGHPKLELVPEHIAYPERFTTEAHVAEVKRRGRKPKVQLGTADEPPANPELSRDASRGLGGSAGPTLGAPVPRPDGGASLVLAAGKVTMERFA